MRSPWDRCLHRRTPVLAGEHTGRKCVHCGVYLLAYIRENQERMGLRAERLGPAADGRVTS